MKKSAGILLYRTKNKQVEILLVHPGGPFWKNKDDGSWSVPKGEFTNEENALDAAIREFEEETGIVCSGNFIELTAVTQKSGKIVYAWALQKDLDTATISSNTFQIEWPPKSGRMQEFPEVDKAEWFDVNTARQKIIPAQLPFISEILALLDK